ncbi:MAG: hypothetical protein CMJ46_01450 [Planctomyces sp.]|nr:hypothetical protein [Planctomyces sp.]
MHHADCRKDDSFTVARYYPPGSDCQTSGKQILKEIFSAEIGRRSFSENSCIFTDTTFFLHPQIETDHVEKLWISKKNIEHDFRKSDPLPVTLDQITIT